ncbi:head-tail joining protein [Sphingomonas sp. YL-JM2C]
MSFSSARTRAIDAIFAHLGEEAIWEGVADPVRVIARDEDQQFGGEIEIVADTHILRVRRSEVASPTAGQVVTLIESGESFTVMGAPKIDRRRVWRCEVEPA